MTPPFFNTHPRACAVVLASSKGSRLFPMTTKDIPKHLLPVAGIPSIVRLLESLWAFSQIVIAIAEDDTKTLPTLLGTNNNTDQTVASLVKGPSGTQQSKTTATTLCWELKSELKRGQKLHVVKLSEDCYGSIDALRIIEETKLIHPETRVVVFPGDLVILKKNTAFLDSLIRPASEDVACTAVLADVLEQDEHGLPLKESAKAKKGGLSRDKEDIEYIALSFPQNQSSTSSWLNSSSASDRKKPSLPRIVLKKSKLDVETDEDMTGSTRKLVIPKSRLRGRDGGEQLVIRTEWSDVHVYSLAPWVRQLILARTKNFSSIQEDLVPLLISRQYRGKQATFGRSVLASLETKRSGAGDDEHMGNSESRSDDPAATSSTGAENIAPNNSGASAGSSTNEDSEDGDNANKSTKASRLSVAAMDKEPYSVLAVVLPAKTTLRANTVPAYLFACKETVTNCGSEGDADVRIPKGSKRNGKFQTLTLEGCDLGSKINMKSSTVGKSCTLGDKCRLNNVVIMDGVTIGEQCSLQNTIIGYGAKLGNNCSLNDCQVGPGMEIPSGTKEKGEPFVAGDIMESDADMIL
mmetsp:Transcript_13378/g.37665  ORF Transcript_13378/g.37665 Transcript_13378/m.37665 type:complete len:579 (-) Transcript_13378:1680-3416(-)|eukprot:CAMPEP_0172361150 /NCGR_PEP_ID=MMETSP1060-20121228/5030_1 /TAXON_ID=37318 /ORGANISM="Pseudo-nitzschia pungens, Strain cf. cingulata" /LENGTH=578 /DNA_ID=CAMNT_0013083327 /DNA_START=223 /DNA_END=1959 /DNA_ORIENTATION=-